MKVTYIISDIHKALPFEWMATGLKDHFEISFILIGPPSTALERFLLSQNIPCQRIHDEQGYFGMARKVKGILREWRPEVVHCHLRRAEIAGIQAARWTGIRKRIYTRHSSTYNHLYHPKGVWMDRITNASATHIVAISENVKTVLMEMEDVPERKIRLIRHGFDLSSMQGVDTQRVERIRAKYGIPSQRFVVGVIARYTWWKGYRELVPALGELREKFPDCFFVFANAIGNDSQEIGRMISEHIPADDRLEIVHEEDIFALYKTFSVYIHVPVDNSVEAFGQTYVEALACGVPSVFTLSGVAAEFIEHEKNALVVPFRDRIAFREAIARLKNEPDLAGQLVREGRRSVEQFGLADYLERLKALYHE